MARLPLLVPVAEGEKTTGLDHRYESIARDFDQFVEDADRWAARTDAYHGAIRSIYRALIPPGAQVLEIGSGRGDLLAALEPSRGVGVDASAMMVRAARERHPGLEFAHGVGETLELGEKFDYVVLSDLVPYVYDLQALISVVADHSHAETRVVANTYSNLWRGPIWILQLLGLKPRRPVRNWVAPRDLTNLFELGGFEVVSTRTEILVPIRGTRLSRLVNGTLARLPGVRLLALTYWVVARPLPRSRPDSGVTVIVPCRDEAGSIDAIVERVPEMGLGTEILFVEGGSRDDTRAQIEAAIKSSERDIRLLVQTGTGKANAVHEGFSQARHDILMILDADLTVGPEDLPKFYEGLISGRGELINGSRLVYEMEPGAMRFLNMVGNRLFAWLMSAVLGQYVRDTLCGTKAIRRDDYERIMRRRSEIARDDPFGDFDLLLGASLLGLRILNVPVRYGARRYGETKIARFPMAVKLAQLTLAGFRRIWMRPVER